MTRYYTGASLGTAAEYGNLPKARSLAVSGNSKLGGPFITYVSTKGAASQGIYALVDLRGRGVADYAVLVAQNLLTTSKSLGSPNGIAWIDGSLYIAISEYFVAGSLVRIDNIDSYALSRTTAPPSAVTLLRDDLPNDSWHGWRYIRADAQKNLYLAIGANCNACNVYGQTVDNGAQYNKAYDANMTNVHNFYQKNATSAIYQFASIYRLAPPYTGTPVQVAAGVRMSVGFDFTATGDMYFTDNGRDDIGGPNPSDPATMNTTRNHPDCELNYLPAAAAAAAPAAANYGFPYCHTGGAGPNADNGDYLPYLRPVGVGKEVVDPDLNAGQAALQCDGAGVNFTRAVQAMGPHTAPLGMRIYKSVSSGTASSPPPRRGSPPPSTRRSPPPRRSSPPPSPRRSPPPPSLRRRPPPPSPRRRPPPPRRSSSIRGLLDDDNDDDHSNSAGDKTNFPAEYAGDLLIAQRGSWDRDFAIGARVMRLKLASPGVAARYVPFLTGGVPGDAGAASGPTYLTPGGSNRTLQNWQGRPVDVEYLPDSTILVSDDEMGAVYRITYCGAAAAGARAPYGVGLCGGFRHRISEDGVSTAPATPAGAPSLDAGCRVNAGAAGNLTFRRCSEFDVSARGGVVQLAFNLRRASATTLVLDGALVAQNYNLTNGNGWVSLATTGGGFDMQGANALLAAPAAGFAGATVAAYRMGRPESGMAGFTATTGWVANGTEPSALLAGDALVVLFSINVPASRATLPTMLALGDANQTSGAPLQHWAIATNSVPIVAADVGAAPPGGDLPLLNPASAAEQTYEPACVAAPAPPAACPAPASPACANGQQYDAVVTLNEYKPAGAAGAALPITLFTTLQGSTLQVAMRVDASKVNGADGYGLFAIPSSDYMTGNDVLFVRKAGASSTAAVNYLMDGYGGFQPSKPATCTFTSIAAVESSPLSEMLATFSFAWPAAGSLKVRVGGGAFSGGTGIDGMAKHNPGNPPMLACAYYDAGLAAVTVRAYPAITTLAAAAWVGTPCA